MISISIGPLTSPIDLDPVSTGIETEIRSLKCHRKTTYNWKKSMKSSTLMLITGIWIVNSFHYQKYYKGPFGREALGPLPSSPSSLRLTLNHCCPIRSPHLIPTGSASKHMSKVCMPSALKPKFHRRWHLPYFSSCSWSCV